MTAERIAALEGGIAPLRRFVHDMTRLVAEPDTDEQRIQLQGGDLLRGLVARDGWLPERFARPSAEHYQQYLLHCDPDERFCVVSFVWGPGQSTPIHDHTVWGLVGVLRGAELATRYERAADGSLLAGQPEQLHAGMIDFVSPSAGDVHKVENAIGDRSSVSIHVYGANIARVRRHVYDPATGAATGFISGYASDVMPNLWSGA